MLNLAFLHFPTGTGFFMLEEDERDLKKAEKYLNDGAKYTQKAQDGLDFLGNVYSSQSEV